MLCGFPHVIHLVVQVYVITVGRARADEVAELVLVNIFDIGSLDK